MDAKNLALCSRDVLHPRYTLSALSTMIIGILPSDYTYNYQQIFYHNMIIIIFIILEEEVSHLQMRCSLSGVVAKKGFRLTFC